MTGTASGPGIIAWLRSPEGEEWSRRRHQGTEPWLPSPQTVFVGQRVDASQDPCGRGPLTAGGGAR